MDATLMQQIDGAENLPTIPAAALEVLRMCRSDDASVREIASVISCDPAMSSRILKLANSSFFGTPIEAATVSQALVRMGLRSARIMALSFSVAKQNQSHDASAFDHGAFWRSSLITAVMAKTIDDWTHRGHVSEAFTAGLFQDIGILTLNNCLGAEYQSILQEATQSGHDLQEVEQEFLGATHAEVAGYMLGTWSIPDNIVLPVEAHHRPDRLEADNPEEARLARVLQMADALMRLFCEGANEKTATRCCTLCGRYLSWTSRKIMKLIREVGPAVQEVGELLSVDIPSEVLARAAKIEPAGLLYNRCPQAPAAPAR